MQWNYYNSKRHRSHYGCYYPNVKRKADNRLERYIDKVGLDEDVILGNIFNIPARVISSIHFTINLPSWYLKKQGCWFLKIKRIR